MAQSQSVNEGLFDASVRHKVNLLRLANGTVRKILAILNKTDLDLVQQIQKLDLNDVGDGFKKRRLEALLKAVREISADAYRQVNNQLGGQLSSLAKYEAGFQANLLASTIPVVMDIVTPAAPLLNALATREPISGRLLKEWTDSLNANNYARVSQAIRLGMIEGQTTPEMIQRIRGTRALKFKDGILEISRRSAEALVRTAVADVSHSARDLVYKQNADIISKIQWVSTLDTRTCPRCAALDGKTYDMGEGPRPPLHINCFPADTLVTTRDGVTGASKHWYDGELCVIRTASGKQLSCTPNHPILTGRGFLPASSIDVGSNVVRDLGHVGPVLTVDVDDKNVPAKIQDVAEAAFGSREMYARPVPISAEDFHGDGGDTDIAIVATNRLLAHGVEPYIFKVIGNLPLVFRNVCLAFLSRRSRFSTMCLGMALSSNRVMRGLGESFALGWRRTFHSLSLLFGSIARLDTGHTQVSVYCGAHAAEVLGYSRNASAPVEQGDHFIGREGNGRHECAGPYFDAAFFKSSEHGVDADAVLAAEICAGKSGEIVLDKVISVDRVDFSGHVYNLETKIGAYIANGIWVHNCRCTTVPVTKSFRELGLDVDEVPAGTRASMNGQVPATQTYEQWLRRQSAEVQDDVLGVTKGALFRRGGLKIRDFINNAGKEYTLDELRKVEAGAFKKANLAA